MKKLLLILTALICLKVSAQKIETRVKETLELSDEKDPQTIRNVYSNINIHIRPKSVNVLFKKRNGDLDYISYEIIEVLTEVSAGYLNKSWLLLNESRGPLKISYNIDDDFYLIFYNYTENETDRYSFKNVLFLIRTNN